MHVHRYVAKGLQLASETKVNNAEQLLLPRLSAKLANAYVKDASPQSIDGERQSTAPMAYISNLKEFIRNYLDRLNK